MNITRVIFSGLLGVILFFQTGCQMAVVCNEDLESRAGVLMIDANDPNNGAPPAELTNGNTKHSNFCRVKYHPSYNANRWMAVEGELNGGRKYPVVLDTGASTGFVVNDIHILENKLAICPAGTGGGNSAGWGKCRLPALHIGEITLADRPCFYRSQHTEVQFCGLPIAKDNAVIVGLPALQDFKYIAFDSINKEAEFSLEKPFEPERPDLWMRYPFVIEEDFRGNAFLLVKIPIAGQEIELQLDTGSGRGLAIAEELWQKIYHKIRNVKLGKAQDLYPYIGLLDCKRGIVGKLAVGSQIIKNAQISVFPDDSPLVDDYQGLLGMQYFQDTVMVLDFERNLMWVKNSQNR